MKWDYLGRTLAGTACQAFRRVQSKMMVLNDKLKTSTFPWYIYQLTLNMNTHFYNYFLHKVASLIFNW
jgi:hypothetical protein